MTVPDGLLLLPVAAATLGVALYVAYGGVGSEAAVGPTVEHARSWCGAHNGTLLYSHAFGHGGLHCQVPNGTVVHPPEVSG